MSSKQFLTIVLAVITVYIGTAFGNYYTSQLAIADQERWSEACIKGQMIYTIVLPNHTMAVNALNDEGIPIKCEVNSN